MSERSPNPDQLAHPNDTQPLGDLSDICDFVRRDGFEMVQTAESGHLGGSSSSVELLVGMYFGGKFNFNPEDSKDPGRDRILIRGHEGPVRYPIFSLLGYVDRDELQTYRTLGSRLHGHEDMFALPGVDITPSGSLGMLLSYGVGSAIANRDKGDAARTIVFLGDGEEQEGNVSEAARYAATQDLSNLICILDKNSKQLSGPTSSVDSSADLAGIWSNYGWDVKEIEDGNNIDEVLAMYDELQNITKPTFVIANTTKGYGLRGAEDHFSGYHTISVCEPTTVKEAIDELDTKIAASGTEEWIVNKAKHQVALPTGGLALESNIHLNLNISPHKGSERNLDYAQFDYFKDFRDILADESDTPFYVLTPDFLRKDIVDLSKFREYANYHDTGLREQHTIAMGHGVSVERPNARIFVNYGDAFLYRALDQINAAAQGKSNMLIAGEYAGISQAQNGKTHQSLSQPGALLHIPEVNFYEPADVQDLCNVFNEALGSNEGVTYVRIHPKDVDLLQRNEADKHNINSFTVHEPDSQPDVTVVSSGMVVHNTVEAAKQLEVRDGIKARVVNAIDLKNLSKAFVEQLVEGKPVITAYNGNPAILHGQVSSAILSEPGVQTGTVTGHGFSNGTTGRIPELEQYTRLDSQGVREFVVEALSK